MTIKEQFLKPGTIPYPESYLRKRYSIWKNGRSIVEIANEHLPDQVKKYLLKKEKGEIKVKVDIKFLTEKELDQKQVDHLQITLL